MLAGQSSVAHDLGPYTVAAAIPYGPRLVSLTRRDGPEMFAQLDDSAVIEHQAVGTYLFRGGHRLWAAPENPPVTYALDDHRCEVIADEGGLAVSGPPDAAGLAKRIQVTLDGSRLVVDHDLSNRGTDTLDVAPWAISQMCPGGAALLPIRSTATGDALQADRSLVLWPYTNLADPRISWLEDTIAIEAVPGPPLKLGSGPRPGPLGYLIDGFLFTKEVTGADVHAAYPDRGAVGQIFLDDAFCELESLGPIAPLEPGATASHREIWDVSSCSDLVEALRIVRGGGAT